MHLSRSSSNAPRLFKCYRTLAFCSLLARCRIPCANHAKTHMNLQKWSDHVVLLAFWLGNVLRATTQLPKAVRHWGALSILTWKFASCHNSVQLFISHRAKWLRTRRFSDSLFLFSDLLSSLLFSALLFSSLTLTTSAFPSVHIVGSLTSKLPSVIMIS